MHTPLAPALAAASGKVVHTARHSGVDRRLASPGVMSDSCTITGTRCSQAPYTTGTETKPPLENTTSGLSRPIRPAAFTLPASTRKGSVKFFTSKYRRSLPDGTLWYCTPGMRSISSRSMPSRVPM